MADPKKPPTVAKPPRSSTETFRTLIAQAEQDGLSKADLVLRVTLRDESKLKRDSSVEPHEIAFKDGKMSFLGVPVVAGGVAESVLDRSGQAD
ncbi:MAG TPA: hypothetical protein VGL66_14350 [Caulobacteraceae bacterium]